MRDEFVESIESLAAQDPNFILLTGDLGFGIFDSFTQQFPDQFINVGIAEQNMIGLASGMALSGKTVFAYSIGNFATLRCLEQIRNDAAYHDANLTVVASGGGFTYGALGMSHHATEDLAIMRALPGITVVAPCDGWQSKMATRALYEREGVSYLRLEKGGDSFPPFDGAQFEIGKALELSTGCDLTLISIGGITAEAIKAFQTLKKNGYRVGVVAMHTLKPFDTEAIVRVAQNCKQIITVEEHSIIGGLGSSVCEVIAEHGLTVRLERMGLDDQYCSIVGDQNYLRGRMGLSADSIVERARSLLNS